MWLRWVSLPQTLSWACSPGASWGCALNWRPDWGRTQFQAVTQAVGRTQGTDWRPQGSACCWLKLPLDLCHAGLSVGQPTTRQLASPRANGWESERGKPKVEPQSFLHLIWEVTCRHFPIVHWSAVRLNPVHAREIRLHESLNQKAGSLAALWRLTPQRQYST